jgi:hypothetical protein
LISGLNVNNDEGRLKRKEEKWISNFQKHHFLTDGGVDKDEQPRSRGTSPQKPKPAVFGATGRANDHKKRKGEEKSPPRSKTARNACHDPNISPEDLVMLGLYRLDDNQQAIYRAFVEMLSGFDDYDKVRTSQFMKTPTLIAHLSHYGSLSQDNIVADAVRDAQGEADLLECYGGTVLPDPSAPPPDTTRPGSSGAQRRSVSPSALRHSADGPITTGAASGTTGSGPVRPRTAGAVGVGGQ